MSDEELALLFAGFDSALTFYQEQSVGARIQLEDLTEEQCIRRFRCSKEHIPVLCDALQLLEEWLSAQGTRHFA